MYQWLRCIAVALMAIIPIAALAAAEPLSVTIQPPSNQSDSETGVVVVSVTNQSSRPLLILMADSALLTDGDHLLNDVMTVTASDGTTVAYQGRASRPSIGDRRAYLVLEPGERKSSRVDLPTNYAVEGGRYTVSYVQRYIEEAEFSPEGAPEHEVRSNPLVLYVNASLIQGKRVWHAPSTAMAGWAPGPDSTCRATTGHPDGTTLINASVNEVRRQGHLARVVAFLPRNHGHVRHPCHLLRSAP